MSTISVLNTDAGLSAKTLVNAEDAQNVTGLKAFNRSPNAPFTVQAGSTSVANLDADKVDGYEGAALIAAASHTGWTALCNGRLTLTSGTPVTTADVTGAATIYFAPYGGNLIALFDGAATWNIRAFTETSVALGTITNDLPYDVFGYDNSGTLALEILAWTSKTARATALTTQNGVLVKSGATTRRYLGTFHTTATTTTEDSFAKRLLWNYYNRVERPMRVLGSGTWNYTTATIRQANASTANQVAVVNGWAEDSIDVRVVVNIANTNAGVATAVYVGEDSTTAGATGLINTQMTTPAANYVEIVSAFLQTLPAVGYHFYAWLEYSAATGTTTWFGAAAGPTITSGISARWRS